MTVREHAWVENQRIRENQKQDGFLTEVFMDGTYSNIYPIYPKIIYPDEWTRIPRERLLRPLFIISSRFRGNI